MFDQFREWSELNRFDCNPCNLLIWKPLLLHYDMTNLYDSRLVIKQDRIPDQSIRHIFVVIFYLCIIINFSKLFSMQLFPLKSKINRLIVLIVPEIRVLKLSLHVDQLVVVVIHVRENLQPISKLLMLITILYKKSWIENKNILDQFIF